MSTKKEEAEKAIDEQLGIKENPVKETPKVQEPEKSTDPEPVKDSGKTPEEVKDLEVVEEIQPPLKSKVIYSKQFGKGSFHGNTLESQREIAKEAGSHLLGEGRWEVSSTVDKAGVTTQYVTKK